MLRRDLLKSSLLGAAAVTSGIAIPSNAQAQTSSSANALNALSDDLNRQLFANDGLARPIATKPTVSDLAKGLDRALVLGGGGEYYVAWYCGLFHGFYEQGLDMAALPEMVVGTSAGSYMGSSLASGHFNRMRTEFDFFGYFPGLFAKMAPLSAPNISQQRAMEINAGARDGEISTLRIIGHAALAADNKLNGDGVEKVAAFLTGDSKSDWPAAKMHTTAVDCYTGERLIVSQAAARKNKIPLARGAAASSSLPGIMGPTLLGQRYAMDGGICSNPAHVDVVAGCKRALVITLNDGLVPPFLTGVPHPVGENIKQVEATGTKVYWIQANPPKDVNLLDPKQIEPALRAGYERAKLEADKIKQFWA